MLSQIAAGIRSPKNIFLGISSPSGLRTKGMGASTTWRLHYSAGPVSRVETTWADRELGRARH